jgi:hypothetical protein
MHGGCPCSYQVDLPPLPAPTFDYGTIAPSIESVKCQQMEMHMLRYHGKFEVMSLVVEAVNVNPVH